MLGLVSLLVLFVAFFLFKVLRAGMSGSYRCPRCSQVQVGRYHLLKCSVVSAQEPDMRRREVTFLRAKSDSNLDNYKRRILALLPGLSGERY